MNFHAIQYGVSESIGIDVDEKIVQVGIDRLAKIHPPPNLQLHVSDLMDPNSVAWKKQKDEQDSVDTEINGNNKTTDDSHIEGLVSRLQQEEAEFRQYYPSTVESGSRTNDVRPTRADSSDP